MRLRKCALLLLSGALLCLTAFPQAFVGYGYDNYSGVNSLLLNPAMLAGSKYKVNVNILAASATAGNNAYTIDRSRLFGFHFSNMREGNGYNKSTTPDYKYAYTNTDILGPSAMFAVDSRDAIGIITRMRTIGNVNNVGNGLFQLLGNPDPNFYNTDIINRSLQVKEQAFGEIGLSLGRVLMKDPIHQLKVGITGKYILGLGYASLSSGQMTLNIDPANNIAKLNADLTTQYSSNLDGYGNGMSVAKALNTSAGKGFGLDFGVMYEWRPDEKEYKLRIGGSVTDIGSVNYKNSANGQTYTVTADGHNTSELEKKDGETLDQYFTRLKTDGLVAEKGGKSQVKVNLPAAVHINVDYHVFNKIYVNADVLANMVASTNIVSPSYITTFTVTPRLEKKWLSIYSPLSYNVQSQLNWGAGFRFGPVFAGSGTLISSFLKKKIETADFHVGITIPIFQSPKTKDKKNNKTDTLYRKILITHDRDSDGVVDDKDMCPDSAGPIALIGCPDRDGDGVPNYRDSCPDVKGSPNFHGCPAPDTDGDGVNDDDDKCPLVRGVESNHGCPPIKPEVLRDMKDAADRIFFVRAKATIEKNCSQELHRVVEIMESDSTLRLHISGHTDSEGTDERNASLSLRRARAVKKWLESQGITGSRLKCEAYGSSKPIAPNSTLEGMAQNRRVDMELTNY